MDTKTRIKYISLTLFVTVFSVWVLFYLIISQTIADSTQKQIALASGQIIERLVFRLSDTNRSSIDRSATLHIPHAFAPQGSDGAVRSTGLIRADTVHGQVCAA